MTTSIPIVDYLVLGDHPHLAAQRCDACGAHYFDRRDGCAACFHDAFTTVPVSTSGTLETFTIVAMAAAGVPVPFAAGVVDCDGIAVRTNLINVEPSPQVIELGMPLQLTTFPIGVDDNGITAIGFGYEPTTVWESHHE
jgi:uncharacterized protein